MLNKEKLLENYNKHVNRYDMTNEKILDKYHHSIRVMEMAIKYSKLLGYNEEDIEIAAIIGLLHDTGRFEQIKAKSQTPVLEEIDEIQYGLDILFNQKLIKLFTERTDWYPIIKYAIENHNKKVISLQGATPRMIMHAKLIRDCDKLDIIKGHATMPYKVRTADDSLISKEILEKFYRKEQLDKKELKTNNERLLIKFSIAFDIKNSIIIPELKQAYKEYYKRVEFNNKFKKIYAFVDNYLQERIKKDNISQ